jgi:hypothetical protein
MESRVLVGHRIERMNLGNGGFRMDTRSIALEITKWSVRWRAKYCGVSFMERC